METPVPPSKLTTLCSCRGPDVEDVFASRPPDPSPCVRHAAPGPGDASALAPFPLPAAPNSSVSRLLAMDPTEPPRVPAPNEDVPPRPPRERLRDLSHKSPCARRERKAN